MSVVIVAPSAGPSGSGSTPTGTGFVHITAGAQDAAAKKVDTADVNANQITNALLAQMATLTMKGNNTGGASDPLDLTVAQVLAMLGSASVYARSMGFSYNTDSTERTIFSFTVNANDFSTNKGVFIYMGGNMLINSGTPTITIRIKYGSTTLWGDVSATIAASATRHAWYMQFFLGNTTGTGAQGLSGFGGLSNLVAASVAGRGEIIAPNTGMQLGFGPFSGNATEDSTANKTLAVTWQFSVSNAADELVMDHAVAVLL